MKSIIAISLLWGSTIFGQSSQTIVPVPLQTIVCKANSQLSRHPVQSIVFRSSPNGERASMAVLLKNGQRQMFLSKTKYVSMHGPKSAFGGEILDRYVRSDGFFAVVSSRFFTLEKDKNPNGRSPRNGAFMSLVLPGIKGEVQFSRANQSYCVRSYNR